MIRSLLPVLGFLVLAAGCATSSEEEPEEYGSDEEICREEAARISGFRGSPKRGSTRIQRRNYEQNWEVYQREYERCMQERRR